MHQHHQVSSLNSCDHEANQELILSTETENKDIFSIVNVNDSYNLRLLTSIGFNSTVNDSNLTATQLREVQSILVRCIILHDVSPVKAISQIFDFLTDELVPTGDISFNNTSKLNDAVYSVVKSLHAFISLKKEEHRNYICDIVGASMLMINLIFDISIKTNKCGLETQNQLSIRRRYKKIIAKCLNKIGIEILFNKLITSSQYQWLQLIQRETNMEMLADVIYGEAARQISLSDVTLTIRERYQVTSYKDKIPILDEYTIFTSNRTNRDNVTEVIDDINPNTKLDLDSSNSNFHALYLTSDTNATANELKYCQRNSSHCNPPTSKYIKSTVDSQTKLSNDNTKISFVKPKMNRNAMTFGHRIGMGSSTKVNNNFSISLNQSQKTVYPASIRNQFTNVNGAFKSGQSFNGIRDFGLQDENDYKSCIDFQNSAKYTTQAKIMKSPSSIEAILKCSQSAIKNIGTNKKLKRSVASPNRLIRQSKTVEDTPLAKQMRYSSQYQ